MHPINALLLAWVVAFALKRRNRIDPLGHWRWVAAAAGSLFVYTEYAFLLMGPGAYAQAYHTLMWGLLLLPFFAFSLAFILSSFARLSWTLVLPSVLAGLLVTWCLGLCTEEGIFPLAGLANWRVGLSLLYPFDLMLAGLCVLGLIMMFIFPMFDRDMARLSSFCALMYVLITGLWAWQAQSFGETYARALNLTDVKIATIPQPLSPLNWRVIVAEPNGRIHDTLINLGRKKETPLGSNPTPAARQEAFYRPKNRAVWRIYRRYGGPPEVSNDMQRRIRSAWQAWQATPFGWYGRYAVFDKLYTVPGKTDQDLGCIGFKDLRLDTTTDLDHAHTVICPGHNGTARVFVPANKEGGLRELIPLLMTLGR